MKNSFKCYIDSATTQKRLFNDSIDSIKDSLIRVVSESTQHGDIEKQSIKKSKPKACQATGWLRGSLSYPWMIISLILPSFLENII